MFTAPGTSIQFCLSPKESREAWDGEAEQSATRQLGAASALACVFN
jgi:hypothetical protein